MRTEPMQILLAEDQPMLLATLSQQLQAEGHRVMEASTAMQALRLFQQRPPDLVLLGVSLPDEGVLALAQRMRQDDPARTPLVFIGPLTSEQALAEAHAAGCDDHLPLPISLLQLRVRLHTLRQLAQARTELRQQAAALQAAQAQLSHQSTHDALTDLGNRRGFDERLTEYLAYARREHKPLTLMLCDVDFFKRYNDRLGHLEGDTCLRHIGQILKQVCRRPLDYAARYGGEEFALLLPGTQGDGGLTFALALQHHMARDSLYHPDSAVAGHVTLSGGLVSLAPDEACSAAELLRRAEEALVAAKSRGRNRFVNLQSGADTGQIDRQRSVRASA
ncbi:diguanylate cyclase [Aquabacterium sp.]|uniref:GGDEF domain-containing protein n=1 Tax=Aquabacterium sp. TaxID=1872578 RepID=UPI0025B9ED55|nr:diguanylate cyclase [Aquabacterium sp.]